VKFGGLKFLDASHIKDVLALLRFVENPRDRVAGFRIMQLLPGVGPSSAQRVLDHISQAVDPIAALVAVPAPPRAGEDWNAFIETITELSRNRAAWPAELECVRQWYDPHLERIHEDFSTRRADLIQLEQIAAAYPSRERFLTELTLDPPGATSDEAGIPYLDEDYLILSTIHSAKGQEWKSVFVLNVVDGCIPSDLGTGTSAEIEEERRLLYVAMTRAKDRLHIAVPQRFFLPMARTRKGTGTSMPPAHASFQMECLIPSRRRLGPSQRRRWLRREWPRKARGSTSVLACAVCGGKEIGLVQFALRNKGSASNSRYCPRDE
jgi:DNA helicase-2/ATP-dependent DNA helicase PcrA